MNYKETCEYLFSQLPQFEKDGATGFNEGLRNTLALDKHLKNPHRNYLTIHVAGTNGKGSCSHTLAAILQTCGYKVGLYTSPHLVDFRERIRINGKPVSEQYVVSFVEKHRSFFEPLKPSFFELATAMAFQYFSDMKVDVAVVEVGLGGRLDCTNIITPELAVITNISYDHTRFLGNTLEAIAAEKGGIIKQGVPVVIGETTDETRRVFENIARDKQAPIIFAEDVPEVLSTDMMADGTLLYHTQHYGDLKGELGGLCQVKNTNTILCAVRQLEETGLLCRCTKDANVKKCRKELQEAFAHVTTLTGLMGRWQTVKTTPKTVCDTGHNVAGWEYLSKQLNKVKCAHLHIIFGMVDDKDVEGVIRLLPKHAHYYFTKADNKRAVPEAKLLMTANSNGLQGEAFDSVAKAYEMVRNVALDDDFIFVGGSTYIVSDFMKLTL